MRPIAVVTKRDIVERILAHLDLPVCPETLSDGHSIGFDVTGEPMPDWVVGADPEPDACQRGPPQDWDSVDPPAPYD